MTAISEKTTSTDEQHEPEIGTTKRIIGRPRSAVRQPVGGFVSFLREKAVVGLALGVVFGTQAKQIVDSLTASFINPLIGLLMPGSGDLANQKFILHHNHKASVFAWGSFAATLISFFIVAVVVYLVIKGFRLDKLDKEKE